MIEITHQRSRELGQQGLAAFEDGQLYDAVSLFQASIALCPHHRTLLLLGECLLRMNRLRESIVPLAAATGLNRGARAPSLLANVFLQLDELDAAEEMARYALGRDASDTTARTVEQAVADRRGAEPEQTELDLDMLT